MAAIENRSRFTVSVKNRSDLSREFPHTRRADALACLESLRSQGYKPVINQGTDKLWVRIRGKGFKEMNIPAPSYAEADAIIQRIESEQRMGLFIDYRAGHVITGAELMLEYLEKEVPKHRGKDVERYTILGWVDDSLGVLLRQHQRREQAILAHQIPEVIKARRIPRRNLQWLQKPFAQITRLDIESYIVERVEADDLSPATVDRELDLWSQVCTWAIEVKELHVKKNPMTGVRRPKYFNERDRRLSEDEEKRLFDAVRTEDRNRCLEIAIESRMSDARLEAAKLPNRSARNRHLSAARSAAIEAIGDRYPIVPLYEALVAFFLVTGARRGEALKLPWDNVDLEQQTALFELTKNGTDRSVPIGIEVIPLLEALPRTHDRVFPVTVDDLKNSWSRICERAEIEDLHIHDLRHSALTNMVQNAFLAGTPLSLLEIQAVSGHRDLASLARYTHLCAGLMARRLDECRAKAKERGRWHKGRPRVRSMNGLVAANAELSPDATKTTDW